MHTINTENNAKRKTQNAKLQFKIQNFSRHLFSISRDPAFAGKFLLVVLPFYFLLFTFVAGCVHTGNLRKAQDYNGQSQIYYERAIAQYKNLINQGKDLDRLYLELGKLYFRHADFPSAIEAFKKTKDPEATKFLAISYYRAGNFTDALEIFNKSRTLSEEECGLDKKVRDKKESGDDEYLYYYGLTAEKLNLFDRALETYKKIKTKRFAQQASERIQTIEKQTSLISIKEISPQIDKVLASAPSQEEYPQAGALILFCDEKIEITPQDTQVTYVHYLIKILNERGKEAFSETHIDYDSTYEKVELEYARTIRPDGCVAEVGTRHIRDVSKYLNFPLYSNARVYIISFPEITEGATIEYKLKIYRSQLINKKDFVLRYPLQASEPIISADFNLALPKEKTLYIKTLNEKYNNFGADLKPNIKEENNRLIYSWRFIDIPQIIPELQMSPNVEINPTMLISTFKDWHQIYNWWWALAKDKIESNEAIKDKVKELTKGLALKEEKIKAIYNFCAKEIRYVAVEYGQAGYEPHHASDIFKNKYGDCKDQAILLVTMLKEAGFLSWPTLIATKEAYNLNEDSPSVLFNHCIVAMPIDDKIIFADPTAQTCSFKDLPADDQDRRVLIFKEDSFFIESTPLYPSLHNRTKQSLKIKVNNDETIVAEKSISTYGIYDQAQRYWLLYTPPELIAESLKERIQNISIGATLEKYNIKNLNDLNQPVVLDYSFKGPEYFTLAGPLRILPQFASLDTSLVAKDKRKYPIDFGLLDCREVILEVALSDNFVVKYMPQNIIQDSPWMKFSIEYTYKNNQLFFIQDVQLKKTKITQDEYPQFKEFFENAAKKIKQRIVLEKIR